MTWPCTGSGSWNSAGCWCNILVVGPSSLPPEALLKASCLADEVARASGLSHPDQRKTTAGHTGDITQNVASFRRRRPPQKGARRLRAPASARPAPARRRPGAAHRVVRAGHGPAGGGGGGRPRRPAAAARGPVPAARFPEWGSAGRGGPPHTQPQIFLCAGLGSCTQSFAPILELSCRVLQTLSHTHHLGPFQPAANSTPPGACQLPSLLLAGSS